MPLAGAQGWWPCLKFVQNYSTSYVINYCIYRKSLQSTARILKCKHDVQLLAIKYICNKK